MPELPEVETTVRGLERVLEGQRLARVDVRRLLPSGPSLAIGFGVLAAVIAAYGIARFRAGGRLLPFQILQLRMFPPIAIIIPLLFMWVYLGLWDTLQGLIILYAAVTFPFVVWLMRSFFQEVPREISEAAIVDGCTQWGAFFKAVLPQAATGIAATAIFCLIFAWNEYAFAVLLTSGTAQTMPPFIPFIIGEGGQDWPAVAAATTLFVIPIFVFTILLRKHLLRGITFGAVRK